MTRQTANVRERGVALLFALGLLALMSVLGVAFVTNSLLAQKTAANIRARNEAKIMLDSAVNRLMITIAAVLHQSDSTDLDVVYSSDTGKDRVKDAKDNTQDLLNEDSGRMRVFIPGQPVYKMSDSKSTWVYVRDAENKVIGRMAYQVLPTGKSSMSLDQVLLGIFNHNEYNTANWGKYGNTDTKVRSSWNARIGKDITELNLGPAYGSGSPITDENDKSIPEMPFVKEWKFNMTDFPANIYKEGYSKANPFCVVPSFDDFYSGTLFKNIVAKDATTETQEYQKIWFQRWFTDSKNAFPEAFYRATKPEARIEESVGLHRFNLGNIDGAAEKEWYNRFSGYAKNDFKNNGVIDELLHDGADFVPGDNAVPQNVISGIPFLSIIGRDSGSFANLKIRRRQIAANLNDYCDEDSIPTSNIPAAEWSDEKLPEYTGNEKTPYINEFVLGLELDPVLTNDTSKTEITIKAKPSWFTEIIDIYGGLNAADYTAKSWLKNISCKLEVTASGYVDFDDNSKDENNNEFTVTKAFEESADGEEKKYAFSSTFTGAFPAGPRYAVTQSQVSDIIEKKVDLTSEIAAKFTGKNIVKRTFTSFKITISDVSFTLTGSGLFTNINGSSTGVDFVRGPENAIKSTDTVSLNLDGTLKPVDSAVTDWKKVYLSGMEVRDPRQNLNFKRELTNQAGETFNAKPSDWKCVPKLQNKLDTTSMTGNAVGTMEINGATLTGSVNSCSNPAAPFNASDDLYDTGTAGVARQHYDKEITTDPAYSGDAKGQYLSTAYIADAPMKTLWELGAIHRGKAWQTINLKRAGGLSGNTFDYPDNKFIKDNSDSGISYGNGDAGILDQVKLTGKAYSSGKLDVNMLLTPSPLKVIQEWDKNIIKALFYNIYYGQQLRDIRSAEPPVEGGDVGKIKWNDIDDAVIKAVQKNKSVYSDGKHRSRAGYIDSGTNERNLGNAFGIISGWNDLADAQQEEIIGKTANLLTAGTVSPATIQAVVIVQTIKSVNAPDGTLIVKPTYKIDGSLYQKDNKDPEKEIKASEFDIQHFSDKNINDKDKDNYVYFDEITSELRALVTIKKINDASGIRLQLHSIQYY